MAFWAQICLYVGDLTMRMSNLLVPQLAVANFPAASYHNNTDVLQYVYPKIVTYGVTPKASCLTSFMINYALLY